MPIGAVAGDVASTPRPTSPCSAQRSIPSSALRAGAIRLAASVEAELAGADVAEPVPLGRRLQVEVLEAVVLRVAVDGEDLVAQLLASLDPGRVGQRERQAEVEHRARRTS